MKRRVSKKLIIAIMLGLLIVSGVLAFLFYKDLKKTIYGSTYSEANASYLTDYYGGKKVLLVVPHEDDDYNVGSGILEQYVDMGSDVRVVWVTNGDAYGGGDRRINESILAMSRLGIPEENMIFLGYGDMWDAGDDEHIYHRQGDMLTPSFYGATETYGTEGHKDYHTQAYGVAAEYKRDNIIADIKDQITGFMPDVIYAVDCDEHQDHRAVSLFFEEVMGQVLAEHKDYKPHVYKGFGYCTAWDCARDYYEDNVLQTLNPGSSDEMEKRNQYRWSDRLRLPVATKTLALTQRSSESYVVLQAFESQDAIHNLLCIVNSDKVFWERETDSLLYDAEVTATSGDASVVNDFKLSDTSNVTKEKIKWNRGIWIPDATDAQKTVTLRLSEGADIARVVLYDSPNGDNHILDGILSFSDGSTLESGELLDNGSPTELSFDTKHGITELSFTITDYVGDEPGIIEIEAYGEAEKEQTQILKLMSEDNFIYDYSAPKGKEIWFSLYTYPKQETEDRYLFYQDGQQLSLPYREGQYGYTYDGRAHTIRVVDKADESIYDEISLRHLSVYDRLKISLARYLEQRIK